MSSNIFNYDPSRFDKIDVQIGAVPVKVYNFKLLASYLQEVKPTTDDLKITDIPIHVHYLLHGRGNSHASTEKFGYHMVDRFYSKKNGNPNVPLIFITFDLPNHGERTISKILNRAWKDGNDKHASDMIGLIDNSAMELQFIMEQLPFHLNLDQYMALGFDYKFKFRNILSGYSLGAEIIFRFVNKYPESAEIINPTIGCSDLSSLLIERLLSVKPTGIKRYLQEYEEIGFTKEQTLLYPKSLHEHVRKDDEAIFENFPYEKVKMFASFGEIDNLVPLSYSKLFCELYHAQNPNTEIFIQPGIGHNVSVEMLNNFVDWLITFI